MQKVSDFHADSTEGDIEQLITSAWKKELQMENNLVIPLKLTISWTVD